MTRIDGSTVSTVLTYNAAGAVIGKAVTEISADQEEKVSESIDYSIGTQTVSIWDFDKTQSWEYLSDTYDSSGRLVSQSGTYNNGQSWKTDFDVIGSQSWSLQSSDYNASGQLVTVYTLNDDGSYTREFLDPTGAIRWSSVINTYDSQGDLLRQDGTYDNGETWFTGYNLYLSSNGNYSSGGSGYPFSPLVPRVLDAPFAQSHISLPGTSDFAAATIVTGGVYVGSAWAWYIYANDFSFDGGQGHPQIFGGTVDPNGLSNELGSVYDYELGLINNASDWEQLPTSVALPTEESGPVDLMNEAADALIGGGSTNTASYSGNNLTVNLATGTFTNASGVSQSLSGIAGVVVTGNNNTLIGSNDDTLEVTGGSGSTVTANGSGNTLKSDSGSNALLASGSGNTLIGGGGSDRLTIVSGSNNILIGGSGTTTLVSNGGGQHAGSWHRAGDRILQRQ